MASSCSFRITRTAEDLAQTITALSQRLVKLEQRQEALELEWTRSQTEPVEEIEILDGVQQLLKDCQELLDTSNPPQSLDPSLSEEEESTLAA